MKHTAMMNEETQLGPKKNSPNSNDVSSLLMQNKHRSILGAVVVLCITFFGVGLRMGTTTTDTIIIPRGDSSGVPASMMAVQLAFEEELLLRVVDAEEDVAQLQADNKELLADNKELLLRVAAIEDGLAAAAAAKNTGSGTGNGNGTNAGGTSMATFMKPIGTVVVAVIGLVALELL